MRPNSRNRGPIDTPMMAVVTSDQNPKASTDRKGILSRVPMGRYGTPEEVAKLIAFLLSEESSYCSGGVFTVDGALSA